MHTPWITAMYAGVSTLLVLALAARVARYRLTRRVGIGDGGDATLGRLVRVHGNAAENVPLALLLLLIAELIGVGAPWLHGFGVALVVGRALHALGLSGSAGTSFGRVAGIGLTWGTMAFLAIVLIVHAFHAL